MKFGVSFAITTPLPRWWSANALTSSMTARLGFRRRDDLEQMQIARRVEEVRAQPVAPEVVAAPFRDRVHRNARRVRADDRSRPARLIDASEQLALHVELLDDGLDDPVGFAQLREALIEAAGCDELPGVRSEERIGLERPRALESLGRGFCR